MADKEQVISAIRATLLSVKGALTIKQCNRDYRELQGEWIPFKKLGYPTLDRLFVDVPGFKVTLINGEWYVDAIASQETQHIAAMVSRQKSSKKPTPRFNITNRFPKKKPATTGSYASYNNVSYNYNNQYSNQYYQAKGGTPFDNNFSNKVNT
ncbi:tudor domain-containing protein 7-like [Cydia fagiglandana]|uniref:tudor domain-containing protein 7-like n=1 Tax=Cydia fagiglandana TaxID=1458189 RepID=UPI002FEE0C4B